MLHWGVRFLAGHSDLLVFSENSRIWDPPTDRPNRGGAEAAADRPTDRPNRGGAEAAADRPTDRPNRGGAEAAADRPTGRPTDRAVP